MTPVLFRLRVPLIILLHIVGFLAPWNYWTYWNQHSYWPGASRGTLWLAVSTLLARTGVMGLANATLTVTLLALLCLLAGTMLRIWGTAYLGPGIMRGGTMRGEHLIAAGPYTHLRNPLYLGTWFLTLATALLMPPDGALFFLATMGALLLFLIKGEESFLAAKIGEPYLRYSREVPRLIPRWKAYASLPLHPPAWGRAILNEVYPLGLTLSFAVFAWRYNAQILVRCLLISYGLSLVVRAVAGKR